MYLCLSRFMHADSVTLHSWWLQNKGNFFTTSVLFSSCLRDHTSEDIHESIHVHTPQGRHPSFLIRFLATFPLFSLKFYHRKQINGEKTKTENGKKGKSNFMTFSLHNYAISQAYLSQFCSA